MRKIQKILFTITILLMANLMIAQTDVIIKGTIKGLNGNTVNLMNRAAQIIATGVSNGDNYEIKTKMEIGDGRFHMIYVPSVGKYGDLRHHPLIFFMMGEKTIEINGEIMSEQWLGDEFLRYKIDKQEIIGSKINDEKDRIQTETPYREAIAKESKIQNKLFFTYNNEEGGMTDENLKLLKESGNKLNELYTLSNNYYIENIANNGKSIAYAGLMNEWHRNSPVETLEKIYNMFDPSIRNVGALVDLKANIDRKRGATPGGLAPDFTLPALNGMMVTLSSFRGKYVLIDFWASWCGPCIKEMPHVISIYEKYKDSGKLQIIGVSTDREEDKWRKKVAELGVDKQYLQLIDKGGETVMKPYDFQGIPYLVIISPDGKILDINLRGQRLIDTIDKYMQK